MDQPTADFQAANLQRCNRPTHFRTLASRHRSETSRALRICPRSIKPKRPSELRFLARLGHHLVQFSVFILHNLRQPSGSIRADGVARALLGSPERLPTGQDRKSGRQLVAPQVKIISCNSCRFGAAEVGPSTAPRNEYELQLVDTPLQLPQRQFPALDAPMRCASMVLFPAEFVSFAVSKRLERVATPRTCCMRIPAGLSGCIK
jgi:hypothetical protein